MPKKLSLSRARLRVGISMALAAGLLPVEFGDSRLSAADWSPATPPAIYPPDAGPNATRRRDFIVDVCTTENQLDCVESIAAFINNAWVEGSPTTTVNNGSDGQPASRNWTIPGITALDGSTELTVTHLINFTGNLLLQTTISSSGTNGDRDTNSLPRDTKFRAVVRTSWVLPTHVSGKMSGAKIDVDKLDASGSSRIMMEGTPLIYMVVLDEATLTSPTGRGAYEVRDFSMTVSDGRFYPIKQDCIEEPAIMTSENGYGHPLPTFADGKLDLKITAPHFLSDGTTEHIGVYEAIVPMKMARCLWGNTVNKSSEFKIDVFESEGTSKSSTKSITVTDDEVVIRASGFTFSSPTVRVTYTAPPETSTSSSTSSTSSSTSSSTTSSVPIAPAKPAKLKAVGGKSVGTISFARVKGVKYTVIARKGKIRKSVRCATSSKKVSCAVTGLTKGRWTVTVTPRLGSTAGPSKSVRLTIG